MCSPPLVVWSGRAVCALRAVLPGAGVGGRRPGGVRGVRRVLGVRVRQDVGRPGARRADAAAVPARARALAVPVSLPVPVPLSVPVPLPVAVSVPLPLRPTPLSVHQIVPLQAPIPILAILVLVFMSAGMDKAIMAVSDTGEVSHLISKEHYYEFEK